MQRHHREGTIKPDFEKSQVYAEQLRGNPG